MTEEVQITRTMAATFQVAAPEPFNFGRPEEWAKWIRRFERFRTASGLAEKEDEMQVNTLIYTMGDRADDILRSLTLTVEDRKKYDKVNEHFVGKRNVIYERVRFNMRRQEEGESVDMFITALYELAEHCGDARLRKSITIVYRACRENASADALSRSPVSPPPAHGSGKGEIQVSAFKATTPESPTSSTVPPEPGQDIPSLLQWTPSETPTSFDYATEQTKGPNLKDLILYLKHNQIPDDPDKARKLAAKASQFVLVYGILTYLDRNRGDRRRVAAPQGEYHV